MSLRGVETTATPSSSEEVCSAGPLPDLLQQYWVRKADIDKSNRRFTIGCLAVLAVLVIAAVAVFRIWR